MNCVASERRNGAANVAPKHGAPPLRCSCTVTGPSTAERSGIASLAPLPWNEIVALPAAPALSLTVLAPLLDIVRLV